MRVQGKWVLGVMVAGAVCIASGGIAQARGFSPVHSADDSDLSGANLSIFKRSNIDAAESLQPDQVLVEADASQLSFEVIRQDHGKDTPVIGLKFSAKSSSAAQVDFITDNKGLARLQPCQKDQTQGYELHAELSSKRYSVTDGGSAYRVFAEVPCSGKVRLIFKQDSNAGQALGIWQIAQRAEAKLQEAVGLDFWKMQLAFVWPDSQGDFYSGYEVHITRGDHWDVVAHELGHGIYDLAGIGVFGGGPHKIDECYSTAMALSEGWASYFSGWVNVDLHDADAKFEYMVPRRAPIRFETIPADVCKGQNNEWRVIGFFWDLVDLNRDGEQSEESFARIWKALEGRDVNDTAEAARSIMQAGISRELLQLVWELNFGQKAPF